MLALREGDVALGSELAESQQRQPGLWEHSRRRAKPLHALMLEGVEHPTPRQQEERSQLQTQLREQVLPGEFDYLALEWPELRAFLQGLGKARAAPGAVG